MKDVDEEEFREFLRKRKLSEKTVKAYVSYVKKLKEYLLKYKRGKGLEEANPRDIKDFALWGGKELKFSINPYLYGIKKYYEYKSDKVMCNAIEEIPRHKPPESRARDLITWRHFEECMENAEKIGITDRNRAILNLLWSEMDSNEILGLYISDIDFKNKIITSRTSGSNFYVTKKAWDALEKYVQIEEIGKRKLLFSLCERRLQQITKKYFESVGQTPKKLRLSCEKDLIEAGRKSRFEVLEERMEKLETKVGWSRRKIEELVFPTKILERLPPEVRKTVEGVMLNYRSDLPDFCFWGMRKALIDGIRIRFKRDRKEEKLYDEDGRAYSLSKWIELAKQERYVSGSLAKKLRKEVKVFGDTASHDYMTSLHEGEVPSIFKHLRLALGRMYYEVNKDSET